MVGSKCSADLLVSHINEIASVSLRHGLLGDNWKNSASQLEGGVVLVGSPNVVWIWEIIPQFLSSFER